MERSETPPQVAVQLHLNGTWDYFSVSVQPYKMKPIGNMQWFQLNVVNVN
jgi:hypothetical protein